MKKYALTICFIISSIIGNAQGINHPTIDYVKVVYKPVSQSTLNNNQLDIQVIPQASITLNPTVTVSKIYFNIFNKSTDSLLYQVNYNINSAVISNASGKKLFENNNGVLFVSPGEAISLRPYRYRIQTEDTLQNLSTTYSVIK